MRLLLIFIITLLVTGCSKQAAVKPPGPVQENLKDLGAVELVPDKPAQFSLGDGKTCVLTGKQLPDCVNIRVVVLSTNAQGHVDRKSLGEIETLPGRQCAIGDGNIMIGLTPTLKTP